MIHEIFPHHFNNQFIFGKTIEENDYFLHYQNNSLLLKVQDGHFELPRKKDVQEISDQTEMVFLFTLDEVPCFLILNRLETVPPQFVYKEIGTFRNLVQPEIAWMMVVGFDLMNWYTDNRFCGKCGTTTRHKADERALICPKCNHLIFPKISPAIIVAIICNDKLLLARNTNFKAAWFSLIAGYADIGESLEETVKREVKEEVGLDVKNIRYYKSQPWPLSGSMMIGFIAEADENQPIVVDHREIAEAAWFKRGNLPDHPSEISIAGEIIKKFDQGAI